MASFRLAPARLQIFSLLLPAIIALTLFVGCAPEKAPVYTKDGKQYGTVDGAFRHRWWNYYERGLSYAEGRYFKAALADLTEARRLRQGDRRMARTYGMHFIDYFPSREIGVICYQQGNLARARSFLRQSIREYPSAKARFYLDRVRQKAIEKSRKIVPPPKITVASAGDEIWTRDDPVAVSGTAADANFVSAVKINGVPVFLEGAQQRVDFNRSVSLAEGRHAVVVTARNLAGKESEKRYTVHVDRSGPVITVDTIRRVDSVNGKTVSFSGVAYDPSGVARIEGPAAPVAARKGPEVFFSGRASPDVDGNVRLVAFDRVGNATEAVIFREEHAGRASRACDGSSNLLVADRASAVSGRLFAGLIAAGDRRAPSIRLKDWQETQTVYLDKIFLEGEVKDDTKVVALLVNDEPVLRRESPDVFFNCTVDLKEGKNRFQIDATDSDGNSSSTKIEVIREIPQALKLSERLSLTVMPFEQKGKLSPMSEGFQDQLIDALFAQDRFRLVERERLDAILNEQKLSQSDLIEKDTAVKLGRLIAANAVLTGSIIATRSGTEIVTRVVDTESAQILATEDVYDEIHSLTDAARLADGLAIKLHREFPLVSGYVVQPQSGAFYTDLGQDKVKLRRRLIVYREEQIKHPVSGKVLGTKNDILGRAVVTEVQPEMSKAEFIDKTETPIRQLDRVITE